MSEVEVEFWSSERGINLRLEMLGSEVTWGHFNNAVVAIASSVGIKKFVLAGPDGGPICAYCSKYVGNIYRAGQFMPSIPAHPFCRHWWDLYLEEVEIVVTTE